MLCICVIVVVCIDLSGKEMHRLVGVGKADMGNKLAWNARYVVSIPALSTLLPPFHHTHNVIYVNMHIHFYI